MTEPSNWKEATEALECPHCHAWGTYLEVRGPDVFCNCCSRTFRPWTRDDREFLRVQRIRPD